jgi:hypothetical protein
LSASPVCGFPVATKPPVNLWKKLVVNLWINF